MARHSPARWLAPSALVAAALALVVVFTTSLGSSSEESASSPSQVEERTSTERRDRTTERARTSTAERSATPETYTVQAGDILSEIAERTGVPVERLRELNPELDANSMSVGQELRLEPEAP
jgi:LysM repeat protein